jgi:hypothetical protein
MAVMLRLKLKLSSPYLGTMVLYVTTSRIFWQMRQPIAFLESFREKGWGSLCCLLQERHVLASPAPPSTLIIKYCSDIGILVWNAHYLLFP